MGARSVFLQKQRSPVSEKVKGQALPQHGRVYGNGSGKYPLIQDPELKERLSKRPTLQAG